MQDANSNPEIEIARVAIRLPPFWRKNVRVWFLQIESQFVTANIVNEKTKYHHVLGSLDSEIAETISDLISKPISDNAYTDLKTRLLAEFEESEQTKVKKLLSELELGDKRPSALLREMRSLSGAQVTDDFLKTMFLQRLPTHIRSILATSVENLDMLATMADKINEISNSNYIASASTSNETDRLSRLEKQLSELTTSVNKLHSRSNSRSKSPFRPKNKVCWYHYKFQNKAKKCIQPCNFSSENKTPEN